MNHSFIKQWHTLTGEYHSQTSDYSAYDSAFGQMHDTVLPFMNDSNVASFTFSLIDENGTRVSQIKWTRPVEKTTEETEETEA